MIDPSSVQRRGLFAAFILAGALLPAACASDGQTQHSQKSTTSQTSQSGHSQHSQAGTSASPSATTPARRVPAFFGAPPDVRMLPPTLPPERFEGQVRVAYQVAKEIPRTLAQLPCFCYCDTIGHKSLHSCYEDEHSAGCGICLDSALLAYRLEKEGLEPPQIRERLIAKYR